MSKKKKNNKWSEVYCEPRKGSGIYVTIDKLTEEEAKECLYNQTEVVRKLFNKLIDIREFLADSGWAV